MSSESDMEKLQRLGIEGNMEQFEMVRNKIISDFLKTFPEETRIKLLTLQYQLDLKRYEMSSEQFMDYLVSQIRLNTAKIATNLERISNILQNDEPANVTYLADRKQGALYKKPSE